MLGSDRGGQPRLRVGHLRPRNVGLEVLDERIVDALHRRRQHFLAEVGDVGNRRLTLGPIPATGIVEPGEQHLCVLVLYPQRVQGVALGAHHVDKLVGRGVLPDSPVCRHEDVPHGNLPHLSCGVTGGLEQGIGEIAFHDVAGDVGVEEIIPDDILRVIGEVAGELWPVGEGELLCQFVKAEPLVNGEVVALLAAVFLAGCGDERGVHHGVGGVENLPLRVHRREPLRQLPVGEVGVKEIGSRALLKMEPGLCLLHFRLGLLDAGR